MTLNIPTSYENVVCTIIDCNNFLIINMSGVTILSYSFNILARYSYMLKRWEERAILKSQKYIYVTQELSSCAMLQRSYVACFNPHMCTYYLSIQSHWNRSVTLIY